MKQVCLLCERTSPDANLYCQETFCPAEMSPTILDYGEWLGDIEIVKSVIVLRSAVLYEAVHQKKTVLLKVAHPGSENKERLKRESEFLRDSQLSGHPSQFLPTIVPPYVNAKLEKDQDAYGKIMLQGHLLYFYMFEFFEGEPLRDIITQNPQLWINHVGWLMIGLSTALAYMHNKGFFHFGVSPEAVLVRFDDDPSAPRTLLFDLGVASPKDELRSNWYSFFLLPAYTAPELVTNGSNGSNGSSVSNSKIRPDYRTDVYGLGTVLYELLVGEPAYSFKLRRDEDVYQAVVNALRVRMNRTEDVPKVAEVAMRSVRQEPSQRIQHAMELAQVLEERFGPIPPKKKSRWPKMKTLMRWGIILLAIAFLITIIIVLSPLAE